MRLRYMLSGKGGSQKKKEKRKKKKEKNVFEYTRRREDIKI
jgi:hypothetical protein